MDVFKYEEFVRATGGGAYEARRLMPYSEFRTRRHAMESAKIAVLDAFCGIKKQKSILAGALLRRPMGELISLSHIL